MKDSISIKLDNVSKKFHHEWIFKNIDVVINSGEKWVIKGGNGSGKSTLLQIISGYLNPDKGEVVYLKNEANIPTESIPDVVSFASPYQQLIEEFTLEELINHIHICSNNTPDMNRQQKIDVMELGHAAKKQIRYYSSGMKQRAKLGLAILSGSPVLLLDEPVSNLDAQGISWFKKMIGDHAMNKTVIVCSNNISDEFFFCDRTLTVSEFKT